MRDYIRDFLQVAKAIFGPLTRLVRALGPMFFEIELDFVSVKITSLSVNPIHPAAAGDVNLPVTDTLRVSGPVNVYVTPPTSAMVLTNANL
jgi:hypothetical protein